MERIAKFEKVSYEQFEKTLGAEDKTVSKEVYDFIEIPVRATSGSAGYDFISPVNFTLYAGESLIIPTGIRCEIADGWVLSLYPRSSLGFKYGMRLNNTVGIIDSDYYHADNEGHIMIKITTEKTISINAGDRIAQGIFTQYGITEDDKTANTRTGGIGSTGN